LEGGFKSELQRWSLSTDLNVLCDDTLSSLNVLQLSAFDVQRRAFTVANQMGSVTSLQRRSDVPGVGFPSSCHFRSFMLSPIQ